MALFIRFDFAVDIYILLKDSPSVYIYNIYLYLTIKVKLQKKISFNIFHFV